jgi:glycosyltransferase involved in cell wall biosynthesis
MPSALSSQRPPTIVVLLSTYNGEVYLAEQLDSLAAQAGVTVRLHIRDDGSTDETLTILRNYAHHWPALANIQSGPNLGAAASFLELLRTAPNDADFYAFCDQDDVWFPDKLARATQAIGAERRPALYCSGFIRTDAALRQLGPGPADGDGRFAHLLFENIAWGCTSVMNAAARELISARLPARTTIIHDWWCASVVAAFGEIIYDPAPSLFYRQHGRNVVGLGRNRISEIASHARRFAQAPHRLFPVHERAVELLEIFGDRLPAEHADLVCRLANSKRSVARRTAYALFGRLERRRLSDSIVARALILAGWY